MIVLEMVFCDTESSQKAWGEQWEGLGEGGLEYWAAVGNNKGRQRSLVGGVWEKDWEKK